MDVVDAVVLWVIEGEYGTARDCASPGSPGHPWDLVEVGVEAVYLLCPCFLHDEVGQGVVEAQPHALGQGRRGFDVVPGECVDG